MRLRIRHTTRLDYEKMATASFNEVRLTPRHDEHQNLLASSVTTDPPAAQTTYVDHFGTLVHAFNVWPPHQALVVTGESTVVTHARRKIPAADSPAAAPLAALADKQLRDREAEWLHPSALASGGDPLRTFARHVQTVVQPTTVVALIEGVCAEVHRRFPYASGTSFVSSTVDDLLERGTGVCQDFAHLTIAALRELGVPARYVSGYFHASSEPEHDVLLDLESHAWVEALVPGHGWVEVDPTNNCPADERHVTVAVGRDYSDVAPLRGVLTGGGGQRLEVSVTMVSPSQVAVETGPSARALRRVQLSSGAAAEGAQQ